MSDPRLVAISKFLSKHLRHDPAALGLVLAPGGWVEVDALLAACELAGHPIERADLFLVVETSDKQRFAFDETGTRLRANQGHSTEVDLQLPSRSPPDVLFHGTAERAVATILEQGLRKMARHHVHLSPDMETARRVGGRHGRPVVLAVDARGMAAAGHLFYCSQNGVWLVDDVPAVFLCVADPSQGP